MCLLKIGNCGLIFMKKTGLILATILVALCVLGLISSAEGQISAPKISLEINGVPVTTLNIPVCSTFTLEFWIRNIPLGYSMVYFDYGVEWDPNLMELKDADPIDHLGWIQSMAQVDPGLIIGKGYTEEEQGWTGDDAWIRFTFHCLGEGTDVMLLVSPIVGTIVLKDQAGGLHDTFPDPFEVTVHQYTRAVGGVVVPINKLAVLSPYLALIGLVGALTATFAIRRRKP